MNYYKAREQDPLPKLLFDLVAESEEELIELGLENDPLVVDQDNIPSYQYGICHTRINNGLLEARPIGEIDDQQALSETDAELAKSSVLEDQLSGTTFTVLGKIFPMHPAVRELYNALFDKSPGTIELITTTGTYELKQADIPAFKTAYQDAVLGISTAITP